MHPAAEPLIQGKPNHAPPHHQPPPMITSTDEVQLSFLFVLGICLMRYDQTVGSELLFDSTKMHLTVVAGD
jgi:hypothetical protein